jgi:predicted helicase
VDEILRDTFGIKDGLADHKRVTVLDFACGTGTFLLEVFHRIFDDIGGADSPTAGLIVRGHMLKNVFGFEYLIAPYTIAHLKLSEYLKDQNHALVDNQRLQVFLTNTLEPVEPQRTLLLPGVTAEVEAAQKIKDRSILAIVGNPPYAYESKNKGKAIARALEGYKFTVEEGLLPESSEAEVRIPLGERNPRALNDDYVKFIRFAQLKMDAADQGVVGIITNHAWLDNPTLSGMRQSLMRTFEQIYVFDLHGNANKKEHSPDGTADKNVFDIKQGVSIALLVKRAGLQRGVWRHDMWGSRLDKYKFLAEASITSMKWNLVLPRKAQYLFKYLSENVNYDSFRSVVEVFSDASVGIVTGRDENRHSVFR